MIKKAIFTILITMLSIYTFAQCPAGQTEVSMDISTDGYGYEIYLELVPSGSSCGSGAAIFIGGNSLVGCNANSATSGGYSNNTTINAGPWCLTNGAYYDILSRDGYGDGGAGFVVNIATMPLYNFSASAASETFSFTVTPPPAIDGAMQHVETPAYVFIGAVDIEGEIKNLGSTTINSMEVNYSINGGATVTQNLSSLNIAPFTTFSFTHPTPWYPSAIGAYTLDLWISNVNGQGADAVPSNDNLTKTINVKNPIPNIIPSYTSTTNTFTYDIIVNSSNQVNTPRDLDFHPNGDLWIINTGTENSGGSTVKVTNPGMTGQSSLRQQDGNAWHFMSLPSGIAFSNNENFATSTSVFDANHNGGTPFTGPSLWSSDPAIYAQPSGGNGSHLDMLHESPYSMGIASQEENIFWLYDDNSHDIAMYDFEEDHGPGNSDHDDGRILRYQGMGLNAINTTIVCHLELDKAKKWLYFVDGGNQRIIRLDITTGVPGGGPSWPSGGPYETLAEYKTVLGFTWEIVVNTGLIEPAGIDIIDDRLVVTDHSNGDIIFYDVSNIPATEIGRLQTNEPGIMGVVLGPEGKIWYANHTLNKVVKIEPSTIVLGDNEIVLETNTSIFPNPATDYISIDKSNFSDGDIQLSISDISGKEVLQIPNLTKNTVAISHLASGVYFVNIDNGKYKTSKKLVIE
jgi:hypothetical protein